MIQGGDGRHSQEDEESLADAESTLKICKKEEEEKEGTKMAGSILCDSE